VTLSGNTDQRGKGRGRGMCADSGVDIWLDSVRESQIIPKHDSPLRTPKLQHYE
jgi:hypothetical protein